MHMLILLGAAMLAADDPPSVRTQTFVALEAPLSEQAQQRAAAMKANAKSFRLELHYDGPADKPFYRLIVSVPIVNRRRSSQFERIVQIDEAEANALIDHLARDGFLDKAFDQRSNAKMPPLTAPGYALTAATDGLPLIEDLGWGLPMIERLDSLRTALPKAAQDDLDVLLGRLSGLRKQWEAESTLDGKAGREDSRIRFSTDGESAIVDITSEFGIDKATVRRRRDEWPKTILVRLHLGGLESFKASGKDVAIEWSVASTGAHETTEILRSGKRVSVVSKDSPFYGELRIIGGEKKIPLKNGCFEVALPAKLFDGNPDELTLEWVDFYRQ